MSRILNRGSVIWWFERGNVIVIYDGRFLHRTATYTYIYSRHLYLHHVCDVNTNGKGKHDLIIRGWTKSGVHICTFKHNRFHSFLSS